MNTPFSRTDLTINDKVSRLIHKIEGRLLYFQEQTDYRNTSPYYKRYVEELAEFESKATDHIKRLESVRNYFNYNQTVDKGISLRTRIQRADSARYVYEDAYKWCRDWPVREEHIESVLGIKMPEKYAQNGDMDFLMNKMEEGAYLTAVEVLKARLMIQINDAHDAGDFVMFGTLTLAPEDLKKVFEKGSTIWKNYITKIKRYFGIYLFGSWRAAKNQQFMSYFAVVEEGALNGRLHIHLVLTIKSPDGRLNLEDPNRGLLKPYKREIEELDYMWKHGYAQFIAVRFSNSDAWGKMGWSWPILSDGQPVEATQVDKITQYLVKYILKAKLNGKEQTWRTRLDKELGKTKLKNVMARMEQDQLEALVMFNKYPKAIKLYGNKVPGRLIRMLATRELVIRYRKDKKNLVALKRDTTLKQLLRNGSLTRSGHKSQSSGNTQAQHLSDKGTSRHGLWKWDSKKMNSGHILTQLMKGREIKDSEVHEAFIRARGHLEECFPCPGVHVTVSGGSRR